MVSAAKLREEVETLRSEVLRERRKLRALQEIGKLIGSSLDLTDLLTQIVERVSEVVEAERSTIYLIDDDTDELWAKISQGEETVEIRLPVGEGIAGHVARTGKSLNIKDAYQDPRFDGVWDRRTGYRTRAILCVPMKNQHGRLIGAVQVLNKASGHFSPEDESILTSLAAQAAIGIENSKLFLSMVGKNIELLEAQEQLERKIRELNLLFEVSQVSAGAEKTAELLQGVLVRTMRALDADAATVLVEEPTSGELVYRGVVGGAPTTLIGMSLKEAEGIASWVARENKGQVILDPDEDPRHVPEVFERAGYFPTGMLCVPLSWDDGGDRGLGAIEFLNKGSGRGEFTSDDLKMASVVANQMSVAIEEVRRKERQEKEERLRALGTALSGVLHDLKTPMTIIKGYSKMMTGESDAEKRIQYAETIQRQVQTLEAMMAETLAFARGETKLLVRKVYVYKFFEELAQMLRHSLGDRINIELDLHDRGVFFFDEGKLQRAVHNLARNAAEASAGRGTTGTFTIGVSRDAEEGLILRFTDDGPGIPPEVRERLFESFSTHGKSGGTGLGLAIVRRVVEDHFGSISVESKPGQTTFEVRIPQLADYMSSAGSISAATQTA